jgi:hypothetical protein
MTPSERQRFDFRGLFLPATKPDTHFLDISQRMGLQEAQRHLGGIQ